MELADKVFFVGACVFTLSSLVNVLLSCRLAFLIRKVRLRVVDAEEAVRLAELARNHYAAEARRLRAIRGGAADAVL